MKTLIDEVVGVLRALGYDARYATKSEITYSVFFPTKNDGQDHLLERHKNVIRALAGERLLEFFYLSDMQFIYIRR